MTYELSHGEALLMGAIEGLTEFLPVSSTGHLIITGDLIGFTGEGAKTFEIAIQLGAILAICWHYRARLLCVLYGLPSDPAARRFALNLLVAFLPAAILGALFHGTIKALLFDPLSVAVALVVGGGLILLVERLRGEPRVRSIDDLSWRDALLVGFAQALALVPGTSRSGATIIGGLAFGLSRPVATEFSFFLAIPTMFAATVFDLGAHFGQLGRHDLEVLGLGFAMAFVSALIAVRTFIGYVKDHSFRPFAYYRIVFGAIVFVYFLGRS
ncbi:MAG: undecaprenyl-diphosphate phosphatase [Pseudomonadota bacterium]|nr:undecaprenyl-diphosphate phosphatase [Pseudomonadota bacterium]